MAQQVGVDELDGTDQDLDRLGHETLALPARLGERGDVARHRDDAGKPSIGLPDRHLDDVQDPPAALELELQILDQHGADRQGLAIEAIEHRGGCRRKDVPVGAA